MDTVDVSARGRLNVHGKLGEGAHLSHLESAAEGVSLYLYMSIVASQSLPGNRLPMTRLPIGSACRDLGLPMGGAYRYSL